jgi:hypothetical protein
VRCIPAESLALLRAEPAIAGGNGVGAGVEIGGSWRLLQTTLVLGVWAVAGLILAPIVLRRMARRESGSSELARRDKELQRVT